MSEINKAIVRRWFNEVWNQGRESTIDELFAQDGIAHGLGETEADVHGPAEFKPFVTNIRGTFPDMTVDVQDMIAEGEKVAAHIILQGTHSGGQLGDAPTGRKVRVEGIVLVRIVNGQVVEAWNSYDQLGLLRQIGSLAAPEPRPEKFDKFLTAR